MTIGEDGLPKSVLASRYLPLTFRHDSEWQFVPMPSPAPDSCSFQARRRETPLLNATLANITVPQVGKSFAQHALELSMVHKLSPALRRILHGHMYKCVAHDPDVLQMHRQASLKFCESLIEEPKSIMQVGDTRV